MAVRYFQGFRPSPRSDAPWNRVRISEAALLAGPYNLLEIQALNPLDADPEEPQFRNFTTTLAALAEGFYEIVFLDASDNEDEAIFVQYPSTGYPTVGELVEDSDVTELTSLSYDKQEALWHAAKIAVEEYVGQTFDFEPDTTKVFDGDGQRSIYLPKRLETLTTLEVAGSALVEGDVYLSDAHDRLHVNPDAGIGNYYERALMDIQGYPSLTFTAGDSTVSVTGDWGWSAFPAPVRDAMRFDMEEQALADANALSSTVHAVRRLGLGSIGQGGLRAELATPPAVSPRVAQRLLPYVWHGQGGRLA
jgi:hypothetical protein